MKIFNKPIVSAAITLAAIPSAQAAGIAEKIRPIEYVQTCSWYGAGFYFIPGTDTCIRIGGALRIDTTFNGGIANFPFSQGGQGGANSYNRNYFSTRERLNLFVDTRTATDLGVLRTYANLLLDFMQGRESIAGGFVENDFLFIQFAGFTFGKAVSMFDPQWTLARPFGTGAFLGGSNNATGIPMLAYTASLNSGLSATISLEDAQPYRSAGVVNTSTPFIGPFGAPTIVYGGTGNTFLGNAQGGDHVPDIVGNLRLDQAWGTAHLGVAGHEIHGGYYNVADRTGGHPDATWGYAVNAAIELKNLPTGIGDSLKVEATFGDGAARYVFGSVFDNAGSGRFAKIGGSGGPGPYRGLAFGYVLDGLYSGTSSTNGSSILRSTAWDISGSYEHYWNAFWRTSIVASYSSISYGSGGNALLLAAANGGLLSTGTTHAANGAGAAAGSFAFSVAQIGARTAWTPVSNLTLMAEVLYTRLNQNLDGTFVAAAGVPTYASGSTFHLQSQNLYNGSLQILRSF